MRAATMRGRAAPPSTGAGRSGRDGVAEEQARRKQAAAAVAPGAENGIGAPQAHADGMVDEVLKEKPKPCSCACARPGEV